MICDICGCDPCQTTTFCAESRRLDAGGTVHTDPQPSIDIPETCQMLKRMLTDDPRQPCECGWPDKFCAFHQAEKTHPPPQGRQLPDGWNTMPLGQLWDVLNAPERFGTAQSTIDAAVYLYKLGPQHQKRWREWLNEHTEHERKDILSHLERRKK